jgi:hypothetical protein
MQKIINTLKKINLILLGIVVVGFIALLIYSRNPYQALEEMNNTIEQNDYENVTVNDQSKFISFTVEDPKANIIFVPGGLVEPDSYSYLAIEIASNGYNVTIVKVPFNLAILQPGSPLSYVDDSLDNYIIGHSLGGVVASIAANQSDDISKVILLGSYPIRDLTNKDTLMITAEFDIAMDQEKFDESLQYVNDSNILFNIEGGNHAQFGWYGEQKGDGEATLTTLEQQNIVVDQIINFIEEE